jgi:hypothetical protein
MKKVYFTPDLNFEAVAPTDILTGSAEGMLAYTSSHSGDERNWNQVFGA